MGFHGNPKSVPAFKQPNHPLPPVPKLSDPARLLRYLYEIPGQRRGSMIQPRVLTHTVTFRCNARCVMCDSWRLPRQEELTLEEIERLYRQLPPLDAVRLTGGEPFVRKDLAEIASLAAQHLKPRFLHVTSNGFLTERILDWVDGWQHDTPLQILISLDGLQAKHDEVRGVPRSFDRAMETLQGLVARRDEFGLKLAVNQTVVDREGAQQYRPLRERLASMGVPVHVVVAYRESATYSMERDREVDFGGPDQYVTFGDLSRDELDQLLGDAEEDLRHLAQPERLAKRYYLAGLRMRLLGTAGPATPRCVALHSHLRVFPNGDVPTCQNNSTLVGNLREQSFFELWHSLQTQTQRRWVKQCSGCWTECEILPSAVYTGALASFALKATLSPATA